MRKRYIYIYTHNINKKSEQRYRIRNHFTNRTLTLATSSTAASSCSHQTSIQISPPLPNDDDNMEVRYNYDDDDMVPQYDTVSQYEYDNNDMEYDDDDMEYDDDMNSQYEYNNDDMIVFDGYEEDDEDNEDDDKNEEDEEEGEGEGERRGEEEEEKEAEERGKDHHHQIVDEAFDKDKMSSYNGDGEFAPYFKNFTTASLFCWLQKHNISTSAYEDLVDILHNFKFNPTRPISISLKKTPSISKSIKNAYQLSIRDIIWYVLNNPLILKHMYFGPGIDFEIKSEYWHDTLWRESPLFGNDQIKISGVIYKSGEFIYYHDNGRQLGRLRAILKNVNNEYRLRIQKVVAYDNLPGIFKKRVRQEHSVAGEV
ncbi:hypothetical protein C1646_756662 [Rhizophagus diaphanus]|nr:hypothetical protein C1646_756662 [Rhizophagus diaphanus] [Rhizophagus sp. MUCL 43196]